MIYTPAQMAQIEACQRLIANDSWTPDDCRTLYRRDFVEEAVRRVREGEGK